MDKMSEHGDKWKIILFIYLMGWFAISFYGLVFFIGNELEGSWLGLNLMTVREYSLYGLGGSAGGTLYAIRFLHEIQMKDNIKQGFYWFLARPLLCAGTAAFTIILLDSGLLPLQVASSEKGRIGLSFLAGFGYGKLTEKLTQVTETLFNGKKKSPPDEPPTKGS